MAMKQREVFARRVPLYRKNPCKFFAEVTGFAPDPWQKEAATAIAQHRKVSIRSGQGVGKTAFEANLVLWFFSCFPYPRVVCTAPTRQQLNDVLWAEIAKWQERSPVLQAMLVWTKTRVYMKGHEKRWFAVARTATIRRICRASTKTICFSWWTRHPALLTPSWRLYRVRFPAITTAC